MSSVHHPVFARIYDWAGDLIERELRPHRRALLAGLRGRVIEVGAGNGAGFAQLPGEVSELLAVEPEPYLRARARRAATRAPVPVRVIDGIAESLPAEAEAQAFDAAVVSLTLCTIADPAAALSELRRVLVPGAELHFLEHVAAPSGPRARGQRWADRSGLWPWLAGGCHCHRDTVAAIERAGFDVLALERHALGPTGFPASPLVRGRARAPQP